MEGGSHAGSLNRRDGQTQSLGQLVGGGDVNITLAPQKTSQERGRNTGRSRNLFHGTTAAPERFSKRIAERAWTVKLRRACGGKLFLHCSTNGFVSGRLFGRSLAMSKHVFDFDFHLIHFSYFGSGTS